MAQGYSNLEINELLIKQIREGVGDLKLDVCSLDPLITLHGVPEGDNGKMYRVVRVFADIGDELDCAFELAHHTRKGPPGGTPMSTPRTTCGAHRPCVMPSAQHAF